MQTSSLPKMVWMEIDLKNKELPIKIADSAAELAKMCGTTVNNVESSASHAKRGLRKRFIKVWNVRRSSSGFRRH